MSTPFKLEPLEISDKKGSMITAQNTEHTVTRNASFFTKLPSSAPVQLIPSDEEDQFTPHTEGTEVVESVVRLHEGYEAVDGEQESPPDKNGT